MELSKEGKGIILMAVIVFLLLWFTTPRDVAKEVTPVDGPVPKVYEVKTGTSYYYSVWVMPSGEKMVYICHQGGMAQTSTFGMTLAVHSDGTPVIPEELGIVIPEDTGNPENTDE